MDRRTSRATLCAAVCCVAALPATASAQVTTDLTDWSLTETVSTWGGGTQFHISSGSSTADYRWLNSPNKTTVISGNSCGDLTLYGSSTIGIGDTSYNNLFSAGTRLCFVLRGRTSSGSGSMVNRDGRIKR
jgi:hypothetical protein